MIIYEEQGPVDTGFKGSEQPVIQNLGPGNIHVYTSNNDIVNNGLLLEVGAVYEFPAPLVEGGQAVWIQVCYAGTSADVRIFSVG